MTMTPLSFAQNLAQSSDLRSQALAVALVARGLSDDDPETFRQGWPLDVSIERAIAYLNLEPSDDLTFAATELAPTISDALLNRRPRE